MNGMDASSSSSAATSEDESGCGPSRAVYSLLEKLPHSICPHPQSRPWVSILLRRVCARAVGPPLHLSPRLFYCNTSSVPHWAATARKVLLVQPSSAASEHVFSLMNTCTERQECSTIWRLLLCCLLCCNANCWWIFFSVSGVKNR